MKPARMRTGTVAVAFVLSTLGVAAADEGGAKATRVLREPRHHIGNTGILPVQPIDDAAWIWHPDVATPPVENLSPEARGRIQHREPYWIGGWRGPVFLRFRREFEATHTPAVIHVSADERFELFLDGRRIARGPDRSDVEHWSYGTYELALPPGPHRLEALCWHLGPFSPIAQLSHRGGFVLKAEGPYDSALTTGRSDWQVARLDGLDLALPGEGSIFGIGGELTARGCGPQWKDGPFVKPAVVRAALKGNPYGEAAPGWKLFPSTLPERLDREIRAGRAVALGSGAWTKETVFTAEAAAAPDLPKWQALVEGKAAVTVPATTECYVLWDLGDYYTACPVLEVSGGEGATVRWGWSEALFLPRSNAKGNRNEFAGKRFRGFFDTFLPDGGDRRVFSTHWWRAGRYVVLTVRTAAAPLTLQRAALSETRYPLESEASFDGGDPELKAVMDLAVRGLQMCSHETFMDCPYYEQLMYVGDSRLEMLTTHAITRDDRLVRRGIELFDYSRRTWGFVNERFPAYLPQHSPTFSMIWALMLRDYAWWRNDPVFVRARAIGLRSMLEHFEPYVNADGLLEALPGWSFMDWVPGWKTGYAPDGQHGMSALNNLLYVYALQSAADVEDSLGEPLLAQRLRARAARTAAAVRAKFWDEGRGLVADNLAHTEYSEHGQCLALLTDTLGGAQAKRAFDGLMTAQDLKRTTIYFSFYLLDTWRKFGRGDLIVERMAFWKDLVKQGLKTPVEAPGDTRSDCHAWGSHPLFHLHASVAGIRPASPGFRTVRVEPLPGPLPKIVSRTPHPDGFIDLNLAFEDGNCRGTVELPAGVTGTFAWRGKEIALKGGKQEVNADE